MSTVVNVHEAKTHLSRLIQAVLDGEEVIIARNGKPCVRLSAVEAPRKRELGFIPFGPDDDLSFENLKSAYTPEELAEIEAEWDAEADELYGPARPA
jgi:prevent-host-death family protein